MNHRGERGVNRAFIALPIPASWRDHCAATIAALSGSGADIRWVRPEGIHLTLSFLGRIEPGNYAALADALRATAGRARPFKLSVSRTGCFPRDQRPRVLWLGVQGGEELLALPLARLSRPWPLSLVWTSCW